MWRDFGISDRQGLVYEALVRYRQAQTSALATELGLTRVQVTRALTRLIGNGMVTRLPGRPARFTAVPPDQVAGSLIADQEQHVSRLRGHAHALADLYRRANAPWQHPAELVEVVEGAANVASAFARLQRQAEREVRGFDRPPYLSDPVAGNAEETHQRQSRGITYRVVYDRSALAIPGRMADIWSGIHNGELARVGEVPMKMVLCDDRTALIPASTSDYNADASYLIHPSSLLDAFIALFEATWERAIALNHGTEPPGDGIDSNQEDADLLGMLAGGSTDESIARTFGWNVRTVRRHVHRLMVDVGAETRFQLGMEAVRKGWI